MKPKLFLLGFFLAFILLINSTLVCAVKLSETEEKQLMQIVKKYANQINWDEIALEFNGKTPQTLKECYLILSKKKHKEKMLKVKKMCGKQVTTKNMASSMSFAIRNSVKILLINDKNEILLMSTDDKSIRNTDGSYSGKFWQLIGGKIESEETIEQAAVRELFEETGLTNDDVVFEGMVFKGKLELKMKGINTFIYQYFVVARTNNLNVTLKNLTTEEKPVVKELRWMSLEDIKNCTEIIYPVVLPKYLPNVLDRKYEENVITIEL